MTYPRSHKWLSQNSVPIRLAPESQPQLPHYTVIRPHVICQVRKTKNTQTRVTDDMEKQAIPCTAGVNILKYSLAPMNQHFNCAYPSFCVCVCAYPLIQAFHFLKFIWRRYIDKSIKITYKYFLKNVYNMNINLRHTKNPTNSFIQKIFIEHHLYTWSWYLSYRYRKNEF